MLRPITGRRTPTTRMRRTTRPRRSTTPTTGTTRTRTSTALGVRSAGTRNARPAIAHPDPGGETTMRLLAIAAVAAIGLMLTGPPTASAQYRTYDPFTGTATTYYYIPPQGVPDSLWIYPYAGG